MDVEGDSDEASDKNEKNVFANWRKVNPYKLAKTLGELCSRFCEKLASDELGYTAEEISKQSVKSVVWVSPCCL